MKCVTYLQKSMPIATSTVMKSLSFLSPVCGHKATTQDLLTLTARFHEVRKDHQDRLQLELLLYQSLPDEHFSAISSSDGSTRRLDEFWNDIASLPDSQCVKGLCQLAKFLLLLLHINAFCEGLFSMVQKVKNNGRHWNSDCFKVYVRTQPYRLRQLAAELAA